MNTDPLAIQYVSELLASEVEIGSKKAISAAISRSLKNEADNDKTDSPRCNKTKITREDILLDGAAFVLRNFLTPEECQDIIQQAETLGLEDCGYSHRIRKTDRVAAASPELAQLLFKRVMPFLEGPIDLSSIAHYPEGVPRAMPPYKWVPHGLNPVFRACRYDPKGFFFPHHDGGFHQDYYNRSIKTFMIYLNDDFEGGETRFFNEIQRHYTKPKLDHIVYSYQPQAGDVLVFNSQITHDGGKLLSGKKYILRSEVMYKACEEERLAQQIDPDHDPILEFT